MKPITYRLKNDLKEQIKGALIFYEKIQSGLRIDFSNLLARLPSAHS